MISTIRVFVTLLLITGWVVHSSWAQTIRGTVVDDSTSHPVIAAQVTVLDSLGAAVTQAITDSAGQFHVAVLPGQHSFRVLRIGYAPTVTDVFTTTPREAQIRVTIRLPSEGTVARDQPYALSPVVVEAQPIERHLQTFHRHVALGMGEQLMREEFEAWHPREVTDVVRRMRGFTILPNANFGRPLPDGNIDMREYVFDVPSRPHHRTSALTECPPVIFLDGAYLGNSQRIDVNSLPLDAIAAVEAYGRLIETPAEYVRPGNECGAIALWTRSGEPGETGSPFELGLRYGGTISGSAFAGGRLGVHLLTRFAGPIDFYPALYLVSSALSSNRTPENSSWMAQIALRATVLHTPLQQYVGSGLILVKQDASYLAVLDDADIDPRYTVFLGTRYAVGLLRPFLELHLLDFFSSSSRSAQTFMGVGVQF